MSLLPTPQAREGDGTSRTLSPEAAQRRMGQGKRNLDDAVALLPTPGAADASGGHASRSGARSGELLLPDLVKSLDAVALLPTPRVAATRTSHGAATRRDSLSGPSLDQAVELARGVLPREFEDVEQMPASWRLEGRGRCWGAYGPAIERWELILGRRAPAPTQAGKRGGRQLSPRFVEFMMGLPEGHVTDVPGLSRNEQLELLGNGVVPQQAAAALRWLLTSVALVGVA